VSDRSRRGTGHGVASLTRGWWPTAARGRNRGVTSYSHLFVHVRELARTRAFYVDLLGLEVLMEHPGYLRVGGREGFHIGFEERDDVEVGAVGIELVVAVDDVDDMYDRLTRAGVRCDTAPADQEWGARHVWLRDPDGYRLSLSGPPAS